MVPEHGQVERYVRLAMANRPELQVSEADIANRSIDVWTAADAVRPQLDVVGRLGTTGLTGGFGSSFEEMVTGQALSAALGLQFSMFIGQRAARANLRLAEWARRQAVIEQKELANQIVVQVRAGIRDVLTATARLEAAREEEKAAAADVRGEQQLLANGKSTPFNVLLKEDTLTGARTRISRSEADRRIALASFWRAMGFLAQNLGVEGMAPRCGREGASSPPLSRPR
jgi:outer membrane protein TolC